MAGFPYQQGLTLEKNGLAFYGFCPNNVPRVAPLATN